MTIDELSARLAKVERANRFLRVAGATGLVVTLAVAAMGLAMPAPKTVQAERFDLLDSDGKIRVQIGAATGGVPSVALYDAHGKPRAILAIDNSGTPALILTDDATKATAMLAMDSKGGTTLSVTDGAAAQRLRVNVDAAGLSGISLFGKGGKNGVVISAGETGAVGLTMLDRNLGFRAMYTLDVDGEPGIQLKDKAGNPVFLAPVR